MIDVANVIGSRPNGWWRDRAGAAVQLADQVRDATKDGRLPMPVVMVLEGDARAGVRATDAGDVRVVHASGSGDDALVDEVARAATGVVVVTADRLLRKRVRALGAETVGPTWLHDRLLSART